MRSDRPEHPVIVSWVPPLARVLDVGCGEGTLSERLARERGASVWGIDVSRTGAAQAARKGVRVVCADLNAGFPIGPVRFDVVVLNQVLTHVRRPGEVLAGALERADRVVVAYPNLGYWRSRLDLLARGRFPRSVLYGRAWHENRQIHLHTHRDFLDLLRRFPAWRIGRRAFLGSDSRTPSLLARRFPGLFAMICILELVRVQDAPARSW
ncbi:MAG: methyltransferase domain-containing protein [Planctomycetes bacterium]|nr:methyltransferase domain-containing protein [Planctomycetota bacterium]